MIIWLGKNTFSLLLTLVLNPVFSFITVEVVCIVLLLCFRFIELFESKWFFFVRSNRNLWCQDVCCVVFRMFLIYLFVYSFDKPLMLVHLTGFVVDVDHPSFISSIWLCMYMRKLSEYHLPFFIRSLSAPENLIAMDPSFLRGCVTRCQVCYFVLFHVYLC